jgi:hypothetical protein
VTTRDKGTHSELRVETRLINLGFAVSTPSTEERYDLVVDSGEEFIAVQVKRMRESGCGSLVFDCKSNFNGIKDGETYTSEEIDGFIAHDPNTDEMYWVPINEAPKSNMRIRKTDPKKKSGNINWHEDYLFENNFPQPKSLSG